MASLKRRAFRRKPRLIRINLLPMDRQSVIKRYRNVYDFYKSRLRTYFFAAGNLPKLLEKQFNENLKRQINENPEMQGTKFDVDKHFIEVILKPLTPATRREKAQIAVIFWRDWEAKESPYHPSVHVDALNDYLYHNRRSWLVTDGIEQIEKNIKKKAGIKDWDPELLKELSRLEEEGKKETLKSLESSTQRQKPKRSWKDRKDIYG